MAPIATAMLIALVPFSGVVSGADVRFCMFNDSFDEGTVPDAGRWDTFGDAGAASVADGKLKVSVSGQQDGVQSRILFAPGSTFEAVSKEVAMKHTGLLSVAIEPTISGRGGASNDAMLAYGGSNGHTTYIKAYAGQDADSAAVGSTGSGFHTWRIIWPHVGSVVQFYRDGVNVGDLDARPLGANLTIILGGELGPYTAEFDRISVWDGFGGTNPCPPTPVVFCPPFLPCTEP